jgi:hypothetical protein
VNSNTSSPGAFHDLHPTERIHDDSVESGTAGILLEVINLPEREQEKKTLWTTSLSAQRVT